MGTSRVLREAEEYAAAMEWYKKAADLGHATAMVMIGNMYRNGDGVKEDGALALAWVEKAADLGDAEAKETVEYLRQLFR